MQIDELRSAPIGVREGEGVLARGGFGYDRNEGVGLMGGSVSRPDPHCGAGGDLDMAGVTDRLGEAGDLTPYTRSAVGRKESEVQVEKKDVGLANPPCPLPKGQEIDLIDGWLAG